MAAFLKMGDVEGESTSSDHKDWMRLANVSAPIFRTLAGTGRDQDRSRGETTLGAVSIAKSVDKATVKLQEACSHGKVFDEAELHICDETDNKNVTYLKYKLKNVVVTSYSIDVEATSADRPMDHFELGYTEVEWEYTVIDPKTKKKGGTVPGSYKIIG